MKIKNAKYIAPLIVVVVLLVVYFLKKSENKPPLILPHYGPKSLLNKSDTVFHTIKNFSFKNQHNEIITHKNIEGKIFVCDYFFTTCKSICPIMSNQMERVQEAYKNNATVLILSHTVNPEEDSVDVLNQYAIYHKAIKGKWHFLTGNKVDLYKQARVSYLLDAEEGNGGEEDFIHTDKFALVDWNGTIRGYYTGIDSIEVSKLIVDIKILLAEKEWKKN